jgi:hypothetical protein
MSATDTTTVVEPGVVRGMDEESYHGDPVPEGSLSYSGAKLLLDSPARYQYTREHPTTKREFDFGHAAHKLVLGKGAELIPLQRTDTKTGEVSTAEDMRSPSTREHAALVRSQGKVPLLAHEIAKAQAMADVVRAHPVASRLLAEGEAEVSLFWRDAHTRVMLRSRCDWVTRLPSGRALIVDYKTTGQSANPLRWGKEAGNLRYFMQDPWYREGYEVLHPDEEPPAFVFIVQEKDPPYLVSVCELDDDSRTAGAEANAVARALFLECMTTGEWPAYAPRVHPVTIPRYLLTEGTPS